MKALILVCALTLAAGHAFAALSGPPEESAEIQADHEALLVDAQQSDVTEQEANQQVGQQDKTPCPFMAENETRDNLKPAADEEGVVPSSGQETFNI